MLPVRHRLTRRVDFARTTRHGARVASAHLVVHLLPHAEDAPARVGFVVSRKVGGSVERHAVTRRLRALAAKDLLATPTGFDLVVRALPGAAACDFATLQGEFMRSLPAARAKAARS